MTIEAPGTSLTGSSSKGPKGAADPQQDSEKELRGLKLYRTQHVAWISKLDDMASRILAQDKALRQLKRSFLAAVNVAHGGEHPGLRLSRSACKRRCKATTPGLKRL
jgi:hypothetical protein